MPIPRLFEGFGVFGELVGGDETLFVGDFFWAADDLASAALDDADEVGGVGQAVDGTGVQPDVTTLQRSDFELASS